MTTIFRAAVGLALAVVVASSSFAATFNETLPTVTGWASNVTVFQGGTPNPVTMTFNVPNANSILPTGDGTLSLDIEGNFSSPSEYFTLTANPNGSQVSLGTVFDGNVGNDDFDFPSDFGQDFSGIQSGTASISQATLANLLQDNNGDIDFHFVFSPGIDNHTFFTNADPESITLTLSFPFESVSGNIAPEPSAFLLGGVAALLLGVFVYRRRRRLAH